MRIKRKRYIITQNNDKEVLCGLAKGYFFKKIKNIGDTAIKTYCSKEKAEIGFKRSWAGLTQDSDIYAHGFNIVEVYETIKTIE